MTLRKLNIPVQPRADGKPPYPKFEPVHPGFTGRSKVLTIPAHRAKNIDGPFNVVDLGANTCTCVHGRAFDWHGKHQKWVPAPYCSHKIRAMSDILAREIALADADPSRTYPWEMQRGYAQAVGSRYNVYEVVSAFHKELRRGSIEHAVFWGHMLANFRGVKGVTRYMLNIIYEETRDHELARQLLIYLKRKKQDNQTEYWDMLYGIKLFCLSPKKWELPHRMEFLEGEMRGYSRLIKEYGRDVARAGNIIPRDQRDKLMKALKDGLVKRDFTQTQYGLKGLQKLQVASLDDHRTWIINTIWDDSVLMRKLVGNSTQAMSNVAPHIEFITMRAEAGFGIGYHELNMFIDSLLCEPYGSGNSTSGTVFGEKPPRLKLGVAPQIPIYAHDNHTWAGKRLLQQFPDEWQPGATQKNIDLRLCGAYMGVVWRHLAFKQHGRIDCDWGDVKWPKWLFETVSNLWY